MNLSPDMLRACYDLLRSSPPFRGWHLPASDEVKFSVMKTRQMDADWRWDGAHHIRVSQGKHTYLPAILMSVAHEMAHIRQHMIDPKEGSHGKMFNRCADTICKIHGFDRGQF